MNDRVEGIILSSKEYRENSTMLVVLTKQFGKITLVAKGTRKITSKYAGSILPFVKGEFLLDYVDGKTMFTMKSMKVLSFHKLLYQDIILQSLCSICCECTEVFVNEALEIELSNAIYTQLEQTISVIAENRSPQLAASLYLSFLLRCNGISPEVDCCVNCQSLKADVISIEEGGFLCDKCRIKYQLKQDDAELLKSFRYIVKADISKFEILEPLIKNAHEVLEKLIEFLEYHVGVKIRSFAFYNELWAIE